MKASQATAAQAEVGTDTSVEILFAASSKDVSYILKVEVPVLLGSEEFTRKAVCAIHAQIVYRSSTAKGLYPETGGEIDLATFIKATEGLKFQGEEAPNAQDKSDAAKQMTAINAFELSKGKEGNDPAEVKAYILETYGWEVEPTLEGLTRHFFRKRMQAKEAAAKGSMKAL